MLRNTWGHAKVGSDGCRGFVTSLSICLYSAWWHAAVGFKSRAHADGHEYRHIVLAVYDQESHKYGTLGISRRRELMDNPLMFDTLADLVRTEGVCHT